MQKTLAVINLWAIRHNAEIIRSKIKDRSFFAVVKADAYGHGAEQVALEIEDIVDGFCVAIVEEGAALRIAGVQKPILVLAPPLSADDAEAMRYYNLLATVGDLNSANLSKGLACHIAINTGMNRYGCTVNGLKKLLKTLSPNDICGVYSHLYAPENVNSREEQLKLFCEAEDVVKGYAPEAFAHLAATAGITLGDKFLKEGVRIGIALYGYAPKGFKIEGLKPALKVYARLAQSTCFIPGGIGYNITDRVYNKLYTYRAGYADGFSRGVPLGEKTLCMDAFISQQRAAYMPVLTDADEYAQRCNTISYEVLCSVTRRSERVYERRIEI
ncbi:MAG: alanine racemase [Candidatus Coproplasma sp.]